MDKRKRGITHTRIQRLLWIFLLPSHVTLVDRGVLKQLQLVTQPLDIRHWQDFDFTGYTPSIYICKWYGNLMWDCQWSYKTSLDIKWLGTFQKGVNPTESALILTYTSYAKISRMCDYFQNSTGGLQQHARNLTQWLKFLWLIDHRNVIHKILITTSFIAGVRWFASGKWERRFIYLTTDPAW